MLDRMHRVEEVFLCLDNDQAGRIASQRMAALLAEKGIPSQSLTPRLKDWNEDLIRRTLLQKEEGPCQILV